MKLCTNAKANIESSQKLYPLVPSKIAPIRRFTTLGLTNPDLVRAIPFPSHVTPDFTFRRWEAISHLSRAKMGSGLGLSNASKSNVGYYAF